MAAAVLRGGLFGCRLHNLPQNPEIRRRGMPPAEGLLGINQLTALFIRKFEEIFAKHLILLRLCVFRGRGAS
jgi:hypothetical protein